MIIIDLQQILISNLMAQLGGKSAEQPDEGLLRHMALNSIRAYNHKFKNQYGEIVIAAEGRSWRYNVFPYYKANRKKGREESSLNWTEIFESFRKIMEELKEYFPYRVIRVENAEADDVIASLCTAHGNTNEKILIISGDKDFQQLQTYINVTQFDPIRKRVLHCNTPDQYLREHIIKAGDDGIPNILSDDDVFVLADKRQKPITQKRLDELLLQYPNFEDEKTLRNFHRNKMLIDLLDCVPEDIYNETLNQFEEQAGKGRGKLFDYMIQYRLKHLMSAIGEF